MAQLDTFEALADPTRHRIVEALRGGERQVNDIVKRHREVLRARLVVEGEAGNDRMTLICEVSEKSSSLGDAIVVSIREVTKLRGEVELADPGTLPNDGKVIEDKRRYT